MKYALLTVFLVGCTVPAEAVLWREVKKEGIATFGFAVCSNFQTISKKHFYDKEL